VHVAIAFTVMMLWNLIGLANFSGSGNKHLKSWKLPCRCFSFNLEMNPLLFFCFSLPPSLPSFPSLHPYLQIVIGRHQVSPKTHHLYNVVAVQPMSSACKACGDKGGSNFVDVCCRNPFDTYLEQQNSFLFVQILDRRHFMHIVWATSLIERGDRTIKDMQLFNSWLLVALLSWDVCGTCSP